ncbi:hypothetical protein NL89_03890 [Bifidobacterium longum subsp. longum]|uniref:hypothetical protein n=1 Tax=Bifidobacterium longum TaxID=216816 RepID=UPI0005422A76|nr:hypothetical protein [Bifidobacterium longum]KHD95254.1 hypothetical protein NL89_03890 [Bifidobacterium longum subsp. longum]
MTDPLDESAKAAAEWVETTPDTVLQACGLVNAYQLGWMDGAMRCADKQATKRVRRALERYPWLTKGQREDIATIAVRAAYGMAWEDDDDE